MENLKNKTVNTIHSFKLISKGLSLSLMFSLLLFSDGYAAESATDGNGIQSEWLNGLLMGKDMSELSANYAAMMASSNQHKATNQHQTSSSNYLLQYQLAEKSFIKDLNKMLKLEGEFEQKHQEYFDNKYAALERQHNKLDHWLMQLKSTNKNNDKASFKTQQINEFRNRVNARWQSINNTVKQPIKNWNDLTRKSLKYLTSDVNNKVQVIDSNEIILRNDRLPFGSRNFSAPTLLFSPEITPSYANESATAGVAADLTTDEVVNLSPEIYQLAASLEHDYIKIYNFVRQQVTEQYYAGSMKGSQGTLLSYAGNDVDQAALLMALLRASNIPSHFVQGVIQQPIDQVVNGLALTDANQVLEALNRAGIAHEPVIQGGQITAIQKHYTWVAAYVPYAHYRGSANDLYNSVWIPLAPAIKLTTFETHELDYTSLGLDDDQIITDYLTVPEGSVGISPITYWQEKLTEQYSGNYEMLLVKVENNSKALNLLPASLPFSVIATTFEGAALPATNLHQLKIELKHNNSVIMSLMISLPEVAGKRISLSYLPATVDDLNIINQAGGMAHAPPHLVDLRPVVKIDSKQIEAMSESIRMAELHDLEVTLISPAGSIEVERQLLSGTYMSLVIGTQKDDYPLSTEDENLTSDETKPIRLIHNLGLNYQKAWNEAEFELAAVMNQAIIRPLPSLILISPEYRVFETEGLPILMQVGGVSVDAISKTVDLVSREGGNKSAWKRISALQGSWLESNIFASQWAVNAISADQGIRQQRLVGENILQITSSNLNQVLPTLNHPEYVKQHITGWVNNGHHALIAENNMDQGMWQGSVWIIWHPVSGDSGYFISGGYAGGQTTEALSEWVFDELAQQLSAPYAEGANDDPLSGRNISMVDSTNYQYGVVNQMLTNSSQVKVTDAQNRPVVNAFVRFEITNQQAMLETESGFAGYLDTYTDANGIAEANVKLAENIYSGPTFLVNPSDENLSQLGLVEISASVNTNLGFIPMAELFNHYAIPDLPDSIAVNECNWNEAELCNRYGGQQEMRNGNIHVVVLDQFGNPISNEAIQITAETPVPQAGISKVKSEGSDVNLHSYQMQAYQPQSHEIQSKGLPGTINTSTYTTLEKLIKSGVPQERIKSTITGRCDVETPAKIAANSCFNISEVNVPGCATGSETIFSDISWSTFTVYNGKGYPATRFPIKISVSGLEDKFINRYNGFEFVPGNFAPSGIIFMGEDTSGPNGDYFAAQPGESSNRSASPYYLSYAADGTDGGCNFIQYTVDSIETQTTTSEYGNAGLQVTGSLQDWDIEYLMGSSASDNFNKITSEDVTFDGIGIYPGTNNPLMTMNTFSKTVTAEVIGRSPEVFVLNEAGTTALSSNFLIEFAPATYRPIDLTAVFYEENQEIYSYNIAYPTTSTVAVILPTGIQIDAEKDYFIEVVLNKETDFEIKYDKFPLEGVQRKLVSAVNCSDDSGLTGTCGGRVINNQFESPIRLSTSLDLPNALVCRNEGFELNLNTAARVTVEAFKNDFNGAPTTDSIIIANDVLLAEGSNSIVANADDFGNHSYSLKITATAEDNGDQEEVYGSLVSTYDLSNSLPIGHAVVKGVDLADGSMVYSKQDIALDSPGVDLEFIRTYSSQGRHELGPLGYGWSHNYLSRVMVGNCGQVTVTGADGGSARFQIVGDEFVPMKGYHSSLVFNQDGSFDFYPKGGNRYHYIKMQDRSWWMDYVEDPNGNRLSVELVGRNDAPVIRSVTDSVGRRMLFEYEVRDFGIYQKEMLVKVTGPLGIELAFDYDGIGNLISAMREGDTTDEVMGYSGEVSGPSRALLLSVSDQATGANRSWSYQNRNIEVPPAVGDIPDIASIEVTSISESDAGSTGFSYTPGIGYNSGASVNQNSQISNYILNLYGAATQISSPAGIRSFDWETDTDVLLMSETDENNRLRTFEYDEFGNTIEENLGSLISTYTYEGPAQFDPPYIKDRVASYTNWRGDVTTYTYDSVGNKTNEELDQITTGYSFDDKGLVKNMTDGRGLVSTFTYDAYGNQKTARNPAGDTVSMQYNPRGQKLNETDANGNITTYSYDDSDRVLIKKLDDRIWTYDYLNGGRIRTESDPNSHPTTYSYDTQGRLINTLNAAGDNMAYVYDLNGNKISETDFGGHETVYNYDDANRLITKSEPLGKSTTYTYDNVGNVLSETTADRVTEYSYDPNRYFQTSIIRKSSSGDASITRTVDGHGNVLTETDPNGNETTYTYDAHDRLLTSNGPIGSGQDMTYDGNGNVLSETTNNSTGNQTTLKSYDTANRLNQQTMPEGGIMSYSYDANGNVVSETRPNGYYATYVYNELNLPIGKTINGYKWLLDYDDAGNLLTKAGPFTGGATSDVTNIITYTYDALNRETAKTDQLGPISIQTYDADSNQLSQTDGNGNFTSYEYNALHQRTKDLKPLGRGRTFSYTLFDELLTDTGPNGTMAHSIDQLGRRTASTGPDDYSMGYGYDLNGNLTNQTDSRNITTTNLVNALNQTYQQSKGSFVMTMTHDTVGNVLSQTDYRGILSVNTYDQENRPITYQRAGQLQSTTTYNEAGLPTVVKDSRGNNIVHEYNSQYFKTRTLMPENQIIAFEPNALGDVELQNNPGPNDITRTYDARRHLKTEANGAGEMTTYEYDLNNNRTAVVKPGGQRWEYDFDAANRLTAVKNIPEAITTNYSYDAADNLETITDAENKVTSFTYDDRNRKLSKNYTDNQIISYTYDPNSNLKSIDLPNDTNISYTFDALNRQTNQDYTGTLGIASVDFTLDGNGNVEQKSLTLNGSTFTTIQSFDNLDRMIQKTDWFGNQAFYTYDANGNRASYRDYETGVLNYTFDQLNRLTQISKAGLGAQDYGYNSAGLRDQIDYANGSQVNYIYDNANRIDLIDNKQSGVTVTSHDYQYDPNGNRTQLTETNIEATQITTYQYDDADRLTQTNYPSYISILTLDKVSNRTMEIIDDPINGINTITYLYNNRDQLTSMTDTDGNATTYQYDAAGNQTEINNNGIITTLTYSPRQRVSSITQGTNPTINYLYDADGFRVQKEAAGLTTRYIYDDQAMIAEINTLGNTIARYYYSDTAIFAETRNGQNSYYLQDAMGTTVAMINQDGSVQVRYNYDVWGNRNNQTGSSDSPFGFTGYQLDETGLYYAQQRYYDPTTARFNREDPLQGNLQTPPSLHRYLYANANPTVYIDPDGRESLFAINNKINNIEDVTKHVKAYKKRDLKRRERRAYKEEDKRVEGIREEAQMIVAESTNNQTLLKRSIQIDETINRAHISACVYEERRQCNEIKTANIRRLNDDEYKRFEINKKSLNVSITGLKSDVFINTDTGDITMAFAGTDSGSFKELFLDLLGNASQVLSPTFQYDEIEQMVIALSIRADELGVNLSFTGHSLGGGLASFASLLTGREATTFNSAGLGMFYQMQTGLTNLENFVDQNSLIEAIFVQGEVLSRLQDAVPGVPNAIGRRTQLSRGSSDWSTAQHGIGNVCKSLGKECNYVPPEE